ncbi:MAG: TIGR02996 domain-containing protein [Planctomycetes bacterium]|nr:TIGR02996 domain-containing protein [Planctomycetota bacterium]
MPRRTKPNADAPYPPGWEPFLAAINADLDDDTPRLVFADWLQENGDEERAEFIRLQCDLANGRPAGGAEHLLTANRKRWLVGLPKGVRDRPDWCVFRRGFIAAMTVLGRHWLSRSVFDEHPDADGRAIRRLTALEELRIEQSWNTVVERPTLAGLRALTLTSAGSGLIESLAGSPVLPSLTDLTILAKSSDGVSQRSFRNLFSNPNLARLRRLRVGAMRLGNVVAEGLANQRFAGLEELRLRHVGLDAHGAEALARSPAVARLRALDLRNNPIGDTGLCELLAAPALRNLEALDLAMCQLSFTSVRALADWEGLRSVRSLNLQGNHLRAADAEIIRDSPRAQQLTELLVA